MRGADQRAGHKRAKAGRNVDLPLMPPKRMDARVKRAVRTLCRIGRQRAGHKRRLKHALRLKQSGKGKGGGNLRAIQKGKSFLRPQHQRRHSRLFKRRGRLDFFAVSKKRPDAHKRRCHMRQRCKIARCADGALSGNDRYKTFLETIGKMCER